MTKCKCNVVNSHLVVSVNLQKNVCVKIGAWITYCFSAKTVDHGHGRVKKKLCWRLKLKVLISVQYVQFINVCVWSESTTLKHIHVLRSVYVTHTQTQTLLLFVSLGPGENITYVKHSSFCLDHEHIHMKVQVFPITLMGTSKGCFQIISSTPAASCRHHQSSR